MRLKIMFALLFLVCGESSADADQVVIADLRDWTRSIAFFVDAPMPVKKDMNAAVEQARELHVQSCASQSEPHWLCAKKQFRYLRGITGMGDKVKTGYVCRDESWISHQRYYPQEMMTGDGCVKLAWISQDKAYRVEWPDS